MRAKGIRVTTSHPVEHIIRSLAGTALNSCRHLFHDASESWSSDDAELYRSFVLGAGVVGFLFVQTPKHQLGIDCLSSDRFLGVVIVLGPTIGPHEYFATCVGLFAGLCTATASGFVKRLGVLMEPETRIIFYLVSVGAVAGTVGVVMTGGFSAWTWTSAIYILALCLCANLRTVVLDNGFQPRKSCSIQFTAVFRDSVFHDLRRNFVC